MSYPAQVTRRPAVVAAATAVLLLMAVAALAYAVAGLVVLGGTVDRFRSAAAGTGAGTGDIGDVVTLLRLSGVLSAVVSLLAGALLAVLALGLSGGRAGARVATWVVCGLGLLCGCCGLAVLVGERAAPLRLAADEQATSQLFGLAGDAHPSWWIPLTGGLSVGQALGYFVVAILLAWPSASSWFRRPTPPTAPASTPRHPPAPTSYPSIPHHPQAPPGHLPAPHQPPHPYP
ncbi:hypothetical protein ACIBTV_17940 [Micromonospora sp. NPDC049366]|uniref:hypothetical protein n=1 Tax=Micromonospora sp. NPDC049366 TaxID=3364271 RepID=UPI003791713D